MPRVEARVPVVVRILPQASQDAQVSLNVLLVLFLCPQTIPLALLIK